MAARLARRCFAGIVCAPPATIVFVARLPARAML